MATDYRKYVYWLRGTDFNLLKEVLASKNISPHEAKKAACLPLARSVEISFAPPETWSSYELCKRQMSWYWVSPFAGQTLVVSSFEIDGYASCLETIIVQGKFSPPSLPNDEEKMRMIKLKGYLEARPPEWEAIGTEASVLQYRWMKALGIRSSFKEVFVSHCANHANFIEPVYFVRENADIIPYSIAKTSHVCSACLELYNIIGRKFATKMVVPCPGAVFFAGLPPNKYIEVLTRKKV